MAEKDIEFDLETGEELAQEVEREEREELDDRLETDQEEVSVEGSDDPDDHDEEDLSSHSDEDREAIRARRREERKQRKQAQREREDTLRRELAASKAVIDELRSKVEGIERRNTGSELAQLDNAKKQTAQEYAYFKDQIRVATESGNGALVADATEKMLQAQQKFNQLQAYEQSYRQRQATPQPLDPRLVDQAKNWMDNNKWYDPSGRDPDSRITLTLDQQLAEEGWDPTTREYWQELDSRVKKYLPHRANSGKISGTKPRTTVSGSGKDSGARTSNQSYRLSAERVQALKDAGLWDDPKQRAEAVRRFREYDQQNGNKA